jgi:hypothetical protein
MLARKCARQASLRPNVFHPDRNIKEMDVVVFFKGTIRNVQRVV